MEHFVSRNPTRRTICGMQRVFRALGPPLPTSSAEPAVPKKLTALKYSEPNSGTTGRTSFQMLNFCFANP
jgi:hypothetical protein